MTERAVRERAADLDRVTPPDLQLESPNVAADLLRLSVAVRAWDVRHTADAAAVTADVAALLPHVQTFCGIAEAKQLRPALAWRLVRAAVCVGMPAGASGARRAGVVRRIREAMDGLPYGASGDECAIATRSVVD